VRRSSLTILTALLVATLAACATAADENPLSAGGSGGDGSSGWDFTDELDEELDERISPDTGLDGGSAPDSDTVVEAALLDVEAFWSRHYEEVYGAPYEPISGGFWAYGPDSDQPPCGEPPPTYADIAQNAFYCPPDDLIAWDNVALVPQLYEEFGGFTVGIVFAHEFGHAVQERAAVRGATVMTELQADCFAGAWTADVEAGGSEYFDVRLDDLDKAVSGFLTLRDGVGTSAQDPAAHGTGFDRIGAFSEGYEQGLERCAAYPDLVERGELVVVEVPFTRQDDFERGGNLPLADAVELAITDLEDFWAVLFTEMGAPEPWDPIDAVTPIDPETDTVRCGETYEGDILVGASFYCAEDDTIYIDAVNLVPALYEIGDYAVATELARQYAYAAQVRLGNLANDLASNLQADCLAGVYASSGFLVNRENQSLVLSPGDLDEAVIAFLLNSDAAEDIESDQASVGSAFQRFDAYRTGFMEGTAACDALADR
jgi:predicted metalloprotease